MQQRQAVAPSPATTTYGTGAASRTTTAAATPLAAADLAARLAAHTIEPELLGNRPRLLRWEMPANYLSRWVLPAIWGGLILQSALDMWQTHRAYFFSILMMMLMAVILGLSVSTGETRRKRRLLRYGIPAPAFIQNVTVAGKNWLMAFDYLDADGVPQSRTVTVPNAQTCPAAGDTMTLLVSPEDASEFSPYFALQTEYRVVPIEATDVSRAVSERVAAARIAEMKAMTTAGVRGTIEPELLGATPRRVRYTSAYLRRCAVTSGWFVALSTLSVVFEKLITAPFLILIDYSLIIWLLFAFVYIKGRVGRLKQLQNGLPVRAVVTDITLYGATDESLSEQIASLLFEYALPNVATGNGATKVSRARAAQLGLEIGATFTVLVSSDQMLLTMPYFQMTDVEIVGAMGARITPPPPATP